MRLPYHNITIAAGLFKQTRLVAYGEVAINIIFSITLVIKSGLTGIALGTLFAVIFRFLFCVVYVSKNIIDRKVSVVIKSELVNYVCFFIDFFGEEKY